MLNRNGLVLSVDKVNMDGDRDNDHVQVLFQSGLFYVCLPGKGWFRVEPSKSLMLEYSLYVRGDPSNSPPDEKQHGVPPSDWYERLVGAVYCRLDKR